MLFRSIAAVTIALVCLIEPAISQSLTTSESAADTAVGQSYRLAVVPLDQAGIDIDIAEVVDQNRDALDPSR